MKQKFVVFSLFLMVFYSYGQTPCAGGYAGEYPCSNYDLLSHIPVNTLANTSGNPEGSDIWGWTDPSTGKEYAIAAMTNSTAFVDVSNPINPIYLGRIDSQNGNTSYWRDVKIYE
jgi:choice-of-anchor B domain-containing protein